MPVYRIHEQTVGTAAYPDILMRYPNQNQKGHHLWELIDNPLQVMAFLQKTISAENHYDPFTSSESEVSSTVLAVEAVGEGLTGSTFAGSGAGVGRGALITRGGSGLFSIPN